MAGPVSHNQRVISPVMIVMFPSINCDFPIKNGDFPVKNGDFPIKNGDFPIKKYLSTINGPSKKHGELLVLFQRRPEKPPAT